MRKISIVLIGIIGVTIGIQYIPKEEQKVLIEEELNNNNTSLAFYIEQEDGNYEESLSLPSTGYTLDTEKSICTNNTTPIWEDDKLYLDNLQNKGTSCYLYFKIYEPTASDVILANKSIQTRSDFSTVLSTSTNGIIFEEQTSDGTTYYFAGDTDENWVSFAGYYWRIIRINEDGSIRMIYNGTTIDQTGTTTQVQTSTFNSSYNNNMYVGYMYQSNQVHGLTSNSTIKGIVDGWYEENLLGEPEEDLLSTEAGFCGDRTPYSGNGIGSNATNYAAYNRLVSNNTPTFECPDEDNDLYTVDESSKGNQALDYPIGLISLDEVWYAGGYSSNNTSYYLYTNQIYWTMSPYYFNSAGYAYVFGVFSAGNLNGNRVYSTAGVRPVINLKADVTITGSGTTTDPYRVEGA